MEAKLLLQHLIIEEKAFTLDFFNQKLLEFDLGYMEANNRPSQIPMKVLRSSSDYSLRQNG